MVKIFADTANLDELKELISWGIVDGCTTNPLIMVKEGNKDFKTQYEKILAMVEGPVSLEVTTNNTEEMLTQARELSKMAKNTVIKIPMNVAGLKAVKILSSEGIKTNVTACMSMKQAFLAAKAGATYVSLFWARIEDMGYDAFEVTAETAQLFKEWGIKSEIIIGSVRQISHVNRALMSGAHILTITPDVLKKMPFNPRTDSTIDEFLSEWDKFQNGQ